MNDKILVTISSDSCFVSFRTYDRDHGKSTARFVMLAECLNSYLASDEYAFYDRDLNNILTITKRTDGLLRVEAFYLDRIGDKLTGQAEEPIIP